MDVPAENYITGRLNRSLVADTTKSLSILFISQYFPPETGAAPTRVQELCTRWQDAGHDVTVLTAAPDYPEGELYDGYANEWVHEESTDGVSVVHTKTIPAASGNLTRRALKFVWFMLLATIVGLRMSRHDVVIATSPQPLTGVAGWIVSQVKGGTFVFEVRDLWPESITSLTDTKSLLLAPLEAVVHFIYRRADVIITVSRAYEPALTDLGVDPDDIWFHPNGANPEFFQRATDEFELEDDLAEDLAETFVVSYTGTIGRAHGLSIVLDAAEQLADFDLEFVLVGHGAEADTLEEQARARELDNVRFVGRRPKTEIPDFLALSDVSLVHLRDVELFRTVIPSKIFEAMAAGVPIALGVHGEAERILTETEAGLVFQPEDPDALSSVLRQLYHNHDLRRELGDNGREAVSESYSWEAIASDYETNLCSGGTDAGGR